LAIGAGAGLADDQKAGKGKKGQNVNGVIKKLDAATGTLTVTVKAKNDPAGKDMEFKVEDTTKVTVYAGEDKKELAGKEGLKNEQFKEGAKVTVVLDDSKKVTEVRIGTPAKKKKNQ
jgi:hypothetical protein